MLLQGLHVLDLSRLLPGGYCTQLLQQQGAEVVKVEPPAGDPMRRMPGGKALFAMLHDGKQVTRLDLKSPEGRASLQARVRAADVLVEGFRPGRMEAMGIGYSSLAAINPRLVYCAITGYGSTASNAGRAGHDLNYLARSGALSLMPLANNLPVIPGLQVADLAGGLQAAFLITAALSQRAHAGRGARVEVSMAGLMRTWTALPRAARRAGLEGLGLTGEIPCYRVYAAADGPITVAALEPKFWATLCKAIDREDLTPRQFDTTASDELQALFKTGSREHWMRRFGDQDVCVEPVRSLDESEAN